MTIDARRANRIVLQEWERRGPAQDAGMRTRVLDDETAEKTADRLRGQGMLLVTELRAGLEIRSTSYVGHVRLGSLEVTVRPKIGWDGLLKLARYAYGLRATQVGPKHPVAHESDSLADLLILQLCAEARALVARGRHRHYRVKRGTLTSPRGQLDVTRLAFQEVSGGVGLPCVLRPRSEDVLLNHAILTGLRIGSRMAASPSVKNEASRSAVLWSEGVGSHDLDAVALQRAFRELNRLSEPYRPALRIVDALLSGTGTSLGETATQIPLPGFFFDMNRFFQQFLSKFLREFLDGFVVRDEHTLRNMLSYARDANPRRRGAPSPRPDFAVQLRGKTIALLDAKYRDLWASKLPRDMLYQLAVYALSQPSGFEAAILYPTMTESAEVQRVDIRDPASAEVRARIALRPVPVARLQSVLADTLSPEGRRYCRQVAHTLALGST